MKNTLPPISPKDFTEKLITEKIDKPINYLTYFKPHIEQAINFAIGPFCWFIPDNKVMKIIAASDNINQLTPFSKKEWIGKDPSFLAQNIYPQDAEYVLSAIVQCAQITEEFAAQNKKNVRINIYGRMLNAAKEYRWSLIQFPTQYFNANGRVESCLFMITDVSHLLKVNETTIPLMTVIDNENSSNQYFKVLFDTKKMLPLNIPHVTKREQEILQLMARGLNTPEIASELYLSYHTIEQHKRNLRQKTATKTSAELMNFVCKNNLF